MKRLFIWGMFALCMPQAYAAECISSREVIAADSLVASSLSKLNGQISIDLLIKVRGEMARIQTIGFLITIKPGLAFRHVCSQETTRMT